MLGAGVLDGTSPERHSPCTCSLVKYQLGLQFGRNMKKTMAVGVLNCVRLFGPVNPSLGKVRLLQGGGSYLILGIFEGLAIRAPLSLKVRVLK